MNQSEFIREATVLAGLFGIESRYIHDEYYLYGNTGMTLVGIYFHNVNRGSYTLDTLYGNQTITTQKIYRIRQINYKRLLLWLKLFMVKYTHVRNQANGIT